jgi:uncharacterized protein (DUF983 family)
MELEADTGIAKLERRLGRLFVAGLTLSAASLVCGLAIYLRAPDTPLAPRFLSIGLIVLMATPLLRVLFSVVEYARMRDWFFVFVTAVVLVQLTVTMIVALRP